MQDPITGRTNKSACPVCGKAEDQHGKVEALVSFTSSSPRTFKDFSFLTPPTAYPISVCHQNLAFYVRTQVWLSSKVYSVIK